MLIHWPISHFHFVALILHAKVFILIFQGIWIANWKQIDVHLYILDSILTIVDNVNLFMVLQHLCQSEAKFQKLLFICTLIFLTYKLVPILTIYKCWWSVVTLYAYLGQW